MHGDLRRQEPAALRHVAILHQLFACVRGSLSPPLRGAALPCCGYIPTSSQVGLRSPFKTWAVAFYPFGELSVHHEVVNVLLRFGEFQLPGHHGHHQGSAAGTLWQGGRGEGGEGWARGPGREHIINEAGLMHKTPRAPGPLRGSGSGVET